MWAFARHFGMQQDCTVEMTLEPNRYGLAAFNLSRETSANDLNPRRIWDRGDINTPLGLRPSPFPTSRSRTALSVKESRPKVLCAMQGSTQNSRIPLFTGPVQHQVQAIQLVCHFLPTQKLRHKVSQVGDSGNLVHESLTYTDLLL